MGLFGWETPFVQGPSKEMTVAMSQIGAFLVRIQEQNLGLTRRLHAVSSSWPLCPMCVFSMMSKLPSDLCVGLWAGIRALWLSIGHPVQVDLREGPMVSLSFSQGDVCLLLLLGA